MFSLIRICSAVLTIAFTATPALAARVQAEEPLYPVSSVLSIKHTDIVYPSIAGHYLVYNTRTSDAFNVVQADASNPASEISRIKPRWLKEALRFGVALNDGNIGYVSNRMGPVSAWMRQGHGDGHVLIANMGSYLGGMVPRNLHASYDGQVWCFETPMEKVLQSRAISQFEDTTKHPELLAQTWRFYDSNNFEHKMGYKTTETGVLSKFDNPALFILQRANAQLTMIPNALDGAVSPDGKRIAFVRNNGGNYDIWMQDVDGSDLVQLSDTKYGEFEPAWSPDGTRIAFASNRDSKGEVRETSIYVVDVKSGRVTRLTNALVSDGAPAWKDNHTIIFHSNRDPKGSGNDTVSSWGLWQVTF